MGLFAWLLRQIRPKPPQHGSAAPSTACPACGITARQVRTDGRCVGCGARLPAALRSQASPQTPPDAQALPPAELPAEPTPAPSEATSTSNASIQPVWENGPMVAVQHNGNFIVMDRDNFDYQYGSGDGPDPNQQDLNELFANVSRVCVLSGFMLQGKASGGKVLLDSSDANSIRGLAACLKIDDDPQTFRHCACLGGPTIELYAGAELVATIGLHHGRSIRWKKWRHDAQLADSKSITRWLQDRGVNPKELEAIYGRGGNIFSGEPGPGSKGLAEAEKLCQQASERATEGNLLLALDLCTRALELEPDLAGGYGLRAQINSSLNRVLEAGADCSAAIDRGLRNSEIYFIRAVALEQTRPPEDSEADCSMALHLNPTHSGAFNFRGQIRARLDRIAEALQDFAEAIRIAPDWFSPYMNRAQVNHRDGNPEAALVDYDRAIELQKRRTATAPEPESAQILALLYCLRGDARFDQFDEDDAETDFDSAIDTDPLAAAGYLGDMWLRRNKFERALWEFDRLISLSPDNARAHLARGSVHEVLGNLEEAESDFSVTIHLLGSSGPGLLMRARVRHAQGNEDESLSDLSEFIRLFPEDAVGFYCRFGVYRKQGALAAAFEDLNSAYRLAPDNPTICNSLGWMLATAPDSRFRDGPRAIALARQTCVATEWQNSQYLDTLAAAYAETGAFEEAILWQTEAVSLSPEELREIREERLSMYQEGQAYREEQ